MHSPNWEPLRYSGDARDVRELFEVYRVGDYLAAFEENRRQQEENIRNKLMADGILLTAPLAPRIYNIYQGACRRLRLPPEAEIFCLRAEEINALAILDLDGHQTHALVGITSGALEQLEDGELAFIIGHELGHFLFEHNRLNALISTDEHNPAVTVLPTLGESLFLRWRKKAEISADRVGLLACGNLPSAARGLMKAAFGLSERNITLNVDALLAQIEEIKGQPELMRAAFASHPLLPIRLKALELFAHSQKAAQLGYPVTAGGLSNDALEEQIDQLMLLTRRYPSSRLDEAVMKTIALGGVQVLAADGDVSDDEIKILIELLHHYFTDEPEKEIITDLSKLSRRLAKSIADVNEHGNEDVKLFILSRLADVALADGALMDQEGTVVLDLAKQLHIPAKTAYSIMVGAAQAVGFKTDAKLNRVAGALKNALGLGIHALPPARSKTSKRLAP